MAKMIVISRYIESGLKFYWDVVPYSKCYQLRVVTFGWENGLERTRRVRTVDNYEAAKHLTDELVKMNAQIDARQFEAIAEERCWETGSR